MLFSNATAYALRALSNLPSDGSYRLARELAARLDLPGPYLAKILQTLTQEGILESVRGPRGGFRLARPAEAITVGDVFRALEGPEAMDGCLLGFPQCGGDHPCPLHATWAGLKTQLEASLTQATLQDIRALTDGLSAPCQRPRA